MGIIAGLVLLAYGMVMAGYLTAMSWSQPILDSFAFRQTQTAVSAYWLLRGGPMLAYQTPVIGFPWSIPFELPMYQWLVAGLSHVLQLSVDHSGRIVSLGFFAGSAVLIYRTAMALTRERPLALACAAMLLCSPLMLFWSRAVMIESTALFFSLAFVWSMAEYLRSFRMGWAVFATVSAVLAALVKVTTFFGFAFVVFCGLLWLWYSGRKEAGYARNLRVTAVAGVAVLFSLVCLKLWLHVTDGLKMQTMWGEELTSSALGAWNYGTLAQRMDPKFWIDVVFGRSLLDGLGSAAVFLTAVAVALTSRTTRAAAVILLAGYLAPFLVFTNLHFVHDYYQYANMACATTLVGVAIWSLMQRLPGARYVPLMAVLVVIAFSWGRVGSHFAPMIRQDMANGRTLQLARHLRANTAPESAVLIIGLDWASDVPYYAERKAVMLPDWLSSDVIAKVVDTRAAFGPTQVGALVLCPSTLKKDVAKRASLERVTEVYATGRRRSLVAGCEVYD
ncbi:4-amino-4-deoxy-L-arabinose transferase-like glycosyltransferase [Lysobacter niastensis]|uniref:4-amino-4-deoxy-L-arabinose transferase-like glycosyltransferase n=1 Tax=Lysobacter niastensis TaxID=380629 RepID=A0ABU1WCH2_9GAMM|nr:glycosyltransferase family 39 protein [Lysobacter niastensis]MDR7135217.1 4-amino-4-deoxy-L-arabinose transferase-like glycosyltransferase [Lysobacter niastensis]